MKILLKTNAYEGMIFRPSKKHIFYKVTAKCGWLIKAERYYPNRKPQGRAYYGYTNLPLSPL